MSYESLQHDGIIRRHRFDQDELRVNVEEMLALVAQDLGDAKGSGISLDAHYGFAYNAARVAAEILMLAEGFWPGKAIGNHAAVFMFLGDMEAGDWADEAEFFDDAREKRNVMQYRRAGVATQAEVHEVADAAMRFVSRVRDWLTKHHPELVPDPPSSPEYP